MRLVGALAAAAVAVAALGGVAAAPDPFAVPDDALVTDHWRFEVPEGHAGPLVVGVSFHYGDAPNDCDLQVLLSGTNSSVPIIYWSERHTPESSFAGAFSSSWSQQAHTTVAGQDLDVREVYGDGGVWSVDSHWIGDVSGPEHRVFAVQHAEAWTREATGYHAPLLIDLVCEHPFAVHGHQLGAEMDGFAADSMEGGTGASVSQVVGRMTYVDGDSWSGTVSDEHNVLRLRTAANDSHVEGELRLRGAGVDLVHPLDGDDDLDLLLQPGTLEVGLDRVSAGVYDRFQGVVFSWHDVDDLATAYAIEFG